jgi:peptidoglycan/xylan/chitin deacetylase (PgdA/CDA1 family)
VGWVNHVRRWAKLPYALVANRLATPVLVLLYHRVCELPSDPQSLAVSPSRFRAQLQWLSKNFPVVRFDQDWSSLQRPSVCITFDDGYADNVTHALPIIEELGLHTTFFITAGMVDADREFWWDELEQLLLIPRDRPTQLALQYEGRRIELATADTNACQRAYQALHGLLRPLAHPARERLLQQLRHWVGTTGMARDSHRAVDTEQLHRLAASPHAGIGAHTVNHDVLSVLPPAAQRQQIADSRDQLAAAAQLSIDLFAYPYGGRRDFNRDTMEICRELGLRRCAANVPGLAYPWTDPMRIPRQVVGDWEMGQFESWLRWSWTR